MLSIKEVGAEIQIQLWDPEFKVMLNGSRQDDMGGCSPVCMSCKMRLRKLGIVWKGREQRVLQQQPANASRRATKILLLNTSQ